MTPEEKSLLETLTEELIDIKEKLPNGELTLLVTNLKELKEDLSELKLLLLNPENGIIVKTNKNTEFRMQEERKKEKQMETISSLQIEIDKLKDWKSTVAKVLWILFTSIVGLTAHIISTGIN